MAEKQVLSIYEPKSINENDEIQRSRALLAAIYSGLSVNEMKMIDFFLSQINSEKDSIRTIVLDQNIIERLLGVQRIRKEVMKKMAQHINSYQLAFTEQTYKTYAYETVNLFSKVRCEQNSEGKWKVVMTCNQDAMPYLYHLKETGYMPYRIHLTKRIKGKYSYRLFIYLLDHVYSFHGTNGSQWKAPIHEVIERLGVTNSFKDNPRRFLDLCLKPAIKELNDLQVLQVSHKTIKTGRNISHVEFLIRDSKDYINRKINVATREDAFLEGWTD